MGRSRQSATLLVEFDSRWEALALTRELRRQRWYLIEPDTRHWDVCIPVEGTSGPEVCKLRTTVEAWLADRRIPAEVTYR